MQKAGLPSLDGNRSDEVPQSDCISHLGQDPTF